MTKWSQKNPRTPKRIAQKALGSVLNGHICKNAVRRLARKAGPMPFPRRRYSAEVVEVLVAVCLLMCRRGDDGIDSRNWSMNVC